jgi:hypothetical protein
MQLSDNARNSHQLREIFKKGDKEEGETPFILP